MSNKVRHRSSQIQTFHMRLGINLIMRYLHTLKHRSVCFGSFLYLIGSVASYSQDAKEYKHALGFTSDNDAYVAFENFDRFYTFGADIFFAWKPDRFLGLEKPIPKKNNYFFRLGLQQEGYTPNHTHTINYTRLCCNQ